MPEILPDLLAPGLRLVICGSAVGRRSAQAGAYYAGPGNRFWTTLFHEGLTPTILRPPEFPMLITYGIGLTDIVKTRSGADAVLQPADFDGERLFERIQLHQPNILVFNGKRAASGFFGGNVHYGYQSGRDIGDTKIHVAPSTSGAARGFWNAEIWQEIGQAVRSLDYGSTNASILPSNDNGR